jgi:hypothetical protein
MPQVELQRALSVPVVPARQAAHDIMHEIAERRGDWADFALYTELMELGLPDVGYVAIPVRVSISGETAEPQHELRFRLDAMRSPKAFPTFDGAIGVDGTGPSSGLVWLAGTYEPPVGSLGAMFDQLVARGMAEKSLNTMLDEIGAAVEARVERRELARARYRTVFSSGD